MQIFGGSGFKIPTGDIFLSGASQMLAMAASNEALRYVSYPTQVFSPLVPPRTRHPIFHQNTPPPPHSPPCPRIPKEPLREPSISPPTSSRPAPTLHP